MPVINTRNPYYWAIDEQGHQLPYLDELRFPLFDQEVLNLKALSAAIPLDWSVYRVFFVISIILSLLGWPGLAREVRGKLLALRGEDFVTAAKVAGCTERVIMFRHLVPSFLSHVIASGTLAIPWMILGETALSFLGIGLQPPAISWGVLLKAAQNVKAIVATPWLLLPGLFVVAMILSFNFLGDGLRDAADPYK